MDLIGYKGRVQVHADEYDKFIQWYMKKEHIRVLKVKEKVGIRTVIDKKTKEKVSQVISKGYEVVYLIYDNFHSEWQDSK